MNNQTLPTYLRANLKGKNLLEASAGTGKTFTVALLYIRALLGNGTPNDKTLTVEQILVVTFTNAATEELIERIRSRIKQAIVYVDIHGNDKPLADVIELAIHRHGKDKTRELLKIAISQISFAKISTIHSFCIDICSAIAIDSGLPIGITLSTDFEVIEKTIEDLWRQNIEIHDKQYTSKVSKYKEHTDLYKKFMSKNISNIQMGQNELVRDEFLQILNKFNLRDFFSEYENILNKAYTIKELNFVKYLEELEKINIDTLRFSKFCVNYFKKDKISKKIKADSTLKEEGQALKTSFLKIIDENPLFKFFDSFPEITGNFIHLVDYSVFDKFDKLLSNRIELQENLTSEIFADRLIQLAAKVSEDPKVAKLMRESLPLAIIDEFQDTDPFQYQLFNNIYQGDNCGLLMVGDPKQAIYTFRGGDIYTYLKAHKDTQQQYDLEDNYRSTESMVKSVNAIFSQVKGEHKNEKHGPFKHNKISFTQVSSKAPTKPIKIYIDKWTELKAVHGEYITDNQDCSLPSNYRKKLVAENSSEYVKKLLDLANLGKCKLLDEEKSERALQPKDIAFLVNSHTEALLIKKALQDLEIPSLTQGRESIFKEPEAYDCWLILRAMFEPSDHKFFETALHAKVNGLDYEKVYEIIDDDLLLQKWTESFHELHDVLLYQGPMVAMSKWFRQIGADNRLMNPKNDRQATNIMQLLEVLQEQHSITGGGYRLLAYLENSIANADTSDEKLIRLESDEDRVKIITIHASKGLEYPVVLVPYAWNGNYRNESKPYSAHNTNGDLIIGFSDDIKEQQKLELFEEKLRLFYVALTRASQHLVLYFLDCPASHGKNPSQGYNKSPLGWYFPTSDDSSTVVEAFKDFNRLMAPINTNYISLDEVDFETNNNNEKSTSKIEKIGKPFKGKILNYLGISSFSAMTRDYKIGTKGADENEDDEKIFTNVTPIGRHALVKGAHIGTALHNVLEHTDFTLWLQEDLDLDKARSELEKNTRFELKSNGVIYKQETLDTELSKYTDWLEEVINTPFINIESTHGKNKALKDLTNWFPELTFTHKLSTKFSKSKLKDLLEKYAYNLSGLKGGSIKGMLTGAIDLVFKEEGKYYLADYKSNYVGVDYQVYDEISLGYYNDKSAYTLQYLIYTLALHKHLKSRIDDYDYASHFGGVYYLFIRGMHPDPTHLGKGVFFHRPKLSVVKALESLICGEKS